MQTRSLLALIASPPASSCSIDHDRLYPVIIARFLTGCRVSVNFTLNSAVLDFGARCVIAVDRCSQFIASGVLTLSIHGSSLFVSRTVNQDRYEV
jgi:hypothetical protein